VSDRGRVGRREFLRTAGTAVTGVTLAGLPLAAMAQTDQHRRPMKIGVIGSGRLGGTVGGFWVKDGHEVMFSARRLDEVKKLAGQLGPLARAGTPREAAAFAEVVLIAVPYSALPQIGQDLAAELRGTIVLDSGHPIPARDGEMAVSARAKGTGVASVEFLPGVRLTRAFNSVGFNALRGGAHRAGEKIAIPLAGDDKGALAVAARLVEDAGFEPVLVGPLAVAKTFDPGTPVFGKALTARELRSMLGLGS